MHTVTIPTPFGPAEYRNDGGTYVDLRFSYEHPCKIGRCGPIKGTISARWIEHRSHEAYSRWSFDLHMYQAKGCLSPLTRTQEDYLRGAVQDWMCVNLIDARLHYAEGVREAGSLRLDRLRNERERKSIALNELDLEIADLKNELGL